MTLREKIEALSSLITDIHKEVYIGSSYISLKSEKDVPDSFTLRGRSDDGEDDLYEEDGGSVTLAVRREPSKRIFISPEKLEAAKKVLTDAGLSFSE